MKLQYWGTAAAEGLPAIFCRCETCKKARERGGKNIRKRPNAMIDGVLKIDFNADTYGQALEFGVDLTDLRYLLITHTHPDHFYPTDIGMRRRGFANFCGQDSMMTVYGSERVTAQLQWLVENKQMQGLMQCVTLQPFETVQIDKYSVTPFPGTHARDAGPLVYAIADGEKTILYCHDSGPLDESVWTYWRDNGMRFDYVSLDCTSACSPINYDAHMNMERNIAMRARLLREGIADEKTVFCCNHFSHNGANSLYDEFVEIAAEAGFITSYDGMTVEI